MEHRCNFCSLQFESDKVLQKHASSFHQQQDAGRAQPILPVVLEKIKIDPELIILDENSNGDCNEGSNWNRDHQIQKQSAKKSSQERATPQIVKRSQQKCRYQCEVCSKQFHLLRYFKKHLTISGNEALNKCQEHYGIINNNNHMPAIKKPCSLKSAIAKPNQATNEEQELQSKCNESQDGPKTIHSKVQIWRNLEKQHSLVEFGVASMKLNHRESLIITTRKNSRESITNNGDSYTPRKLYCQNLLKPSTKTVEVQTPVVETIEMSPAAQITTCKECHLACVSIKYLCIHYSNEHKLPVVAMSRLDKPNLNQKDKDIIYNNCTQTGFKCNSCQHTFPSQLCFREHTSTGPCYIHHSADGQHKSRNTDVSRNEIEKSKFGKADSITNTTARNLKIPRRYNLHQTTLSTFQIKKCKLIQNIECCVTRQVSKQRSSSRTILKRDATAINRIKSVQKPKKTIPTLIKSTLNTKVNLTGCHICNICKQEFSKRLNLKQHKVTAHQLNPLECDICQKVFKQIGNLNIHKSIIHKGVRYACDLCQKRFTTKRNANEHRLTAHSGFRYECDICLKKFNHSGKLKLHKQTAHDGFRYKCELCVKEYTALYTLKQHQLSEHDGLKNQCDICQKRFNYKGSLKQHKLDQHGGLRFKCELCVKDFTSPKHLKQHKLNVHSGVRFQCELCVKEYTRLDALKQHKLSEHDGFKSQCDICQKDFISKSALKRHTLVEHGGLRFKCELCSKEFTSLHYLKQHKLSAHDGVRHKCDIYQYDFALQTALKQHKLVAHSSFRFKCEICQKEFLSPDGLRYHKRSKHGVCCKTCDVCQKQFPTPKGLRQHKLTEHGSANETSNESQKTNEVTATKEELSAHEKFILLKSITPCE